MACERIMTVQKEYIEREALEKQLNERLKSLRKENGYYDHYTDGYDEAVDTVENAPTADVAPVVHGEWMWNDDEQGYNCPHCPTTYWKSPDVPSAFKYCPICGAKMDGGEKG